MVGQYNLVRQTIYEYVRHQCTLHNTPVSLQAHILILLS